MGKKVKVVTKCGEEHVYTYNQDVDTVEIIEKKRYRSQERLDAALEALRNECVGVRCGDCAFRTGEAGCGKQYARELLQKTNGYNESS